MVFCYVAISCIEPRESEPKSRRNREDREKVMSKTLFVNVVVSVAALGAILILFLTEMFVVRVGVSLGLGYLAMRLVRRSSAG